MVLPDRLPHDWLTRWKVGGACRGSADGANDTNAVGLPGILHAVKRAADPLACGKSRQEHSPPASDHRPRIMTHGPWFSYPQPMYNINDSRASLPKQPQKRKHEPTYRRYHHQTSHQVGMTQCDRRTDQQRR
jgi:hypothetical protein